MVKPTAAGWPKELKVDDHVSGRNPALAPLAIRDGRN
jgi:hypothetical protein